MFESIATVIIKILTLCTPEWELNGNSFTNMRTGIQFAMPIIWNFGIIDIKFWFDVIIYPNVTHFTNSSKLGPL